MALTTGTRLGHFEILAPLGKGGMGEVYRAKDLRLDRQVAIKIIPDSLSTNADLLARFEREVKAVAALSHPNILSIYGFDHQDGRVFAVMELLEGESLYSRLAASRLPLPAALEIAGKILDGLTAAHAKGIVHRDLKPDNIFITRDGQTKILDFGLARQFQLGKDASSTPTDVLHTQTGMLLGTLGYMSPEQALGKVADFRSDLFSFGCVLYEMLTGRRAFARESVAETLAAIIRDDPPRPSDSDVNISASLEILVFRCLEKDPERRFQSATDLAAALKLAVAASDAELVATRAKLGSDSKPLSAAPTFEISRPRSRFLSAPVVIGVAGLALLVGSWFVWKNQHKPAAPANPNQYVQLTDFNDSAVAPALSADGHMLTFIRGGAFASSAAKGEVYIKVLPDGEPVKLTHDEGETVPSSEPQVTTTGKHTPTFSPDGSRIIYTRVNQAFRWDSWQVSIAGGETSEFLPNASGLRWIEKDKLMFAKIEQGVHMGIVTSSQNRIGERKIYLPTGEGSMAHRSALSPDGKNVLIVEMDGSGWLPCRLLPFDGSSIGKQVGPLNGACTTTDWSPDGKWMYFSSNAGGAFHVWRQAYPDGTPEQITFGTNEQEGTAIAPDGKSLVTAIGVSQSAIWLHDPSGDRQLTSSGFAMTPHISPDGKFVYFMQRSGSSRSFINAELWSMDLSSGRQDRVLPGFLISHYDISSDGKRVVFAAAEGEGRPGIWIADLDRRSSPRQLTTEGEFRAFYGPGGKILFLSQGNDRYLSRINEDGSGRERVSDVPILYLISVSPDGRWAGVVMPQQAGKDASVVKLFPTGGGAPTLVCDSCVPGYGPARQQAPLISWSSDAKTLYLSLQYFGLQSKKTAALPFDSAKPPPFNAARSDQQFLAIRGARLISETNVYPTLEPAKYLFVRRSASANLYRVPLPE